MKSIDEKLQIMKTKFANGKKARVMIIGLGSVGNYLLDYLVSSHDENLEICVVGRNDQKMQSDVNIVRVASMIRGQNRSNISIIGSVDLTDVEQIANAISSFEPDIIVNSSRAYSGLKYGSISWANIRAYGIWSPLAIRFTKNIMQAYEKANSNAIVINTSYSDAVIPWLKTAGISYPDFGSGNINHLIPRLKFAVAHKSGIKDFWNIDVTFAVSHFHDVVISKEGHSEGVDMLIDIRYQNKKCDVKIDEILSCCNIAMPTDAKRNQMNASSNFEIIHAILVAVRCGKKAKLHCPGVFGEIGGYPVIVDGSTTSPSAYICQDYFSIEDMRTKNRESIYLDGIENVSGGILTYTDELLAKVKNSFCVDLPKNVSFEEIDKVATLIIKEIIEKQNR